MVLARLPGGRASRYASRSGRAGKRMIGRIVYVVLGAGLTLYGLFRALGTGAYFADRLGVAPNGMAGQIEAALAEALPRLNAQAVVPLPLEGYLGWSLAMGVALTLGGVLALFRARGGFTLIALYHALFALLFVNYQTLNEKLAHLGVSLAAFLVMVLIARRR